MFDVLKILLKYIIKCVLNEVMFIRFIQIINRLRHSIKNTRSRMINIKQTINHRSKIAKNSK